LIESKNPEVDLNRLTEHLKRKRLDDRELAINLDDSDILAAHPRPVRATVPPYSPAQLQPHFVPREDRRYEVHALMAYRDAAFVRVAFLAVLGREPDPQGYEHYQGMLRAGRPKAEILGHLRHSEEGKAYGAEIRGLKPRFLLARVASLRGVGKVAELASAVMHLPAALRNQRNFEDYVVSVVGQVQENARAQSERLRLALEALAADQDAILDLIDHRLLRQRTRTELLRGAINTGRGRAAELERALERQQRSLDELKKALADAKTSPGESHALDGFYAEFESRFRGTRDEIKKRQSVYLPYITQAGAGTEQAPVLDLGCGRGEWLELLAEHRLVARGADLNHVFLKDNHARGFDVIEMDALKCLQSMKDNSVGAITAFHVIEHLNFKILVALVDEALRVLKPGGVLIFETPNPANLQVGASNFYLDPTHLNPIPSGLAAALLELRGLKDVSVKELHPFPESEWVRDGGARADATLNRVLFGPQDYGVLGWKANG
jgi:O-antigen chain-terminating methyltransferase